MATSGIKVGDGNKLYSFDPSQVSVVIGGIEMSGFSDGSFITVRKDGANWDEVQGADGDVVRAKRSNKMMTLQLTLLQTSPCNDVLSAWAILDHASMSGAVACSVSDNSGTTFINAQYAYVSEMPETTFSDGVDRRQWSIRLVDATTSGSGMYIGGNARNLPIGGHTGAENTTFAGLPTMGAVGIAIEAQGALPLNAKNVKNTADILGTLGAIVSGVSGFPE